MTARTVTIRKRFAATIVLRPSAGVSFRVHRRSAVVIVIGGAAVIAMVMAGLTIGDFPLSFDRVLAALLGFGDEDAREVVLQGRFPRLATGVVVGMALGLSGAIVQAVARNPLASPDILGITAGASLGAVLVLLLTAGAAGAATMSVGATVGAAIVAAVVMGFAWRTGFAGFRLLLIGIGISATLASVESYALLRLNPYDIQRLIAFLSGDLYASSWDDAATVGLALIAVCPIVFIIGSSIRALELGDDVAGGIGVEIGQSRVIALILAVVLAGAAVAAAGPVAFVALVSPLIARMLTKTPGAALGPSAVTGACLVVVADLVARRIIAPVEIPVGLITALIGAPVMLYLMIRSARRWRTT